MTQYITAIVNVSSLFVFMIMYYLTNSKRNKSLIELKEEENKKTDILINIEKGRNYYNYEEQRWFSFIVASMKNGNIIMEMEELQNDFRMALNDERYEDAKKLKLEINEILNDIVEEQIANKNR